MINHARTLLLNRDASTPPGFDYPGEHVVPSGFQSMDLPTYLDRVREKLFGSNPDRAMLNYRLHQYMSLLHASPYESYVTDLDSRVTYLDPSRRDLFDATSFTPNIRQIAGSSEPSVFLQGTPASPDAWGRLYHRYTVEYLNPDFRVTTSSPTNGSADSTPTFTDSLSDQITLGDSGYGLLIGQTDLSTSDTWLVDFFLRPTWSLGEIAATMKSIGEPTLLQLFGVSNTEPYATFRNLWEKNPDTPESLAGILLATIYRTEEVRIGG